MFLTGASSGIGLATALALLEQGHEVWGTSRDWARLPTRDRFHGVVLDLLDPESVNAAFANSLREAERFDVMINNAGSGHFDSTATLSTEIVHQQFQTLVFAQLQLCQLALASMGASGVGLIINVTSLASRLPVPFMGAYNAAKAAMASFTMSLQLEAANTAVRIVDLQPGDIRTAFNDAVARAESEQRLAQTWKTVDDNMKAAPPPELVARRILALLDSANPPPQVTVGDTFQAVVAPAIFRLLPQRTRIWGLRKYYRL